MRYTHRRGVTKTAGVVIIMTVSLLLLSHRTCRAFQCTHQKRSIASFRELLGQRQSLLTLSAARNGSDDEKTAALLQEIARLNNGETFNINSPKQVSVAIFGKKQSASKAVLQQAALGMIPGLAQQKQQLASVVLKHRELASFQRKKTTSIGKSGRLRKPRKRESMVVAPRDISSLEEQSGPVLLASRAISSLVEEANNGEEIEPPNVLEKEIVRTEVGTVVEASEDDLPPKKEGLASAHELLVHSLFEEKRCQVDPYWKEPLLQLCRPSARSLVTQLDAVQCPMGFDPAALPFDPLRSTENKVTTTTTAGKKGSFLAYCREQKERYPDCILLTRCGDFYETFGVDAILLVEHCGLNSMAGKAKAGCPIRNVQATLDCLTSQGFRVAVYEEGADTDASAGAAAKGGAKSRIKSRFLAQIVSAASPTYLYDLILLGNTDTLATAPPSRPYVGIMNVAAGYTLVEVSAEERSVRVSERLTPEAVACRLAAYPPADPLLYVPSAAEYLDSSKGNTKLPFLPTRREGSARLRTRILPPSLIPEPKAGISEVERAKNCIVSALLQTTERQEQEKRVSPDDFTIVSSSLTESDARATRTHPLYAETATQLGLMSDPAIPSLISYLVADSAPAATRRFWRRMLLNPPPPAVAESVRELVSFLKEDGHALPPLAVPPVGKVLALLRAGQASAEVHAELLRAMHGTVLLLDTFDTTQEESNSVVINSLMTLLEYESGLAADPESLRQRCVEAMNVVESVVSPIHHVQEPGTSDESITEYGSVIPAAFFERNELSWRGRVQEDAAPESYARVSESAQRLAEAVANDFWGVDLADILEKEQDDNKKTPAKNIVMQDIFNNLIALKDIPGHCKSKVDKEKYYHPRDRNGKVLKNRYTTDAVSSALSDYVSACDQACNDVTSVLVELAERLFDEGHIPAIVQAAHANLILSACFHHAIRANWLGWNVAETYEESPGAIAGSFVSLWPYWIDKSEAVANSFDMVGMWLLTAPNMSGKSTLMRSTAAAALLASCGLCAPLQPGSKIRRFDHIFVRGASADVPSEQKSAFGAEMGDIAALLRSCGSRSLVFVDELGRGTSPRDGTRLAGAILETMADAGMSGVFATHLHDILELPLISSNKITNKRMAIREDEDPSKSRWTYRLEDGICTDSMALITAERFGLPTSVIERAKELSAFIPEPANGNFTNMTTTDTAGGNARRKNVAETSAPPKGLTLADVARLAEELTLQTSYSIPPRFMPPAALDGKSSVYILRLDTEPPLYYVGETDNFRNRIEQHRSKRGMWTNLSAIVLPAHRGKSQARAWESRLIQRLSREGLEVESTVDGRKVRPDARP